MWDSPRPAHRAEGRSRAHEPCTLRLMFMFEMPNSTLSDLDSTFWSCLKLCNYVWGRERPELLQSPKQCALVPTCQVIEARRDRSPYLVLCVSNTVWMYRSLNFEASIRTVKAMFRHWAGKFTFYGAFPSVVNLPGRCTTRLPSTNCLKNSA